MDPYQSPDSQSSAVLEAMATRLEDRGKNEQFNQFIDQYLERVDYSTTSTAIDLGCGTGVVTRRLATRLPKTSRVIGIDISENLLEVARASSNGGMEYLQADASSVPLADGCADLVVMHTLLSHVPDPVAVLREAKRLLTPKGQAIIFDADYASTTYAISDFERGREIDQKLFAAIVHNLDVCRMMPRHLKAAGLELTDHLGNIIVDAGTGDFWHSSVLGFAKLIPAMGILPADEGEAWVREMLASHEDGTFFAAGNYYTYFSRPL